MERQRRARREEPRRVIPRPEAADSSAGTAAAPAPAAVQVIFGPVAQSMDLQSMSVGDAYNLLQHTLNIPTAQVTALVDGQEADASRILELGQTLEFVRMAGEKGARA